jgi:hypothetical protein
MIKPGDSGAPTFVASLTNTSSGKNARTSGEIRSTPSQWRGTLIGLAAGIPRSPDRSDRGQGSPCWNLFGTESRRRPGDCAAGSSALLDYAREPDDSRWLKTKLGEQSKSKLDKKTRERIPRRHHAANALAGRSGICRKVAHDGFRPAAGISHPDCERDRRGYRHAVGQFSRSTRRSSLRPHGVITTCRSRPHGQNPAGANGPAPVSSKSLRVGLRLACRVLASGGFG